MDDIRIRRALSLAGIFQAAGLVQEIARRGTVAHPTARDSSIASIFATDPDSVADVFGGPGNLRLGLTLLRDQLRSPQTGRRPADLELARYVIGLTVLERKLARQPRALNALGEGIESARRTYEHFGADHANVAARLADIYSEHISGLGSRIIVQGSSDYLGDDDRVAQIRALLLAGLRAAVLWRQQGGRRWQLLLARNRYLAAAETLLADPSAAT